MKSNTSIEDSLSYLKDAVERRHEVLSNLKRESGKKIFGYFSTYTPEEILHSLKIHPTRILASPTPLSHADSKLQSFCCSLVRSCLNEGLSSRLNYLDGVIFSSGTCDSLRNMAEIWQSSVGIEVFFLSEPAKLDRGAISYFSYELLNLIKKLEVFQGEKFFKKALQESIEIYNENRLLLSEIYKFRLKHPEIIPYSKIFYVVVSSQILPKEQHNRILKEILSSLENKISSKESGISLFISGSYLSSPRLFEWIEDLGGCVVSDDLSSGSRYFDFQIKAFGVETLAASYLKKTPNPVKFDEDLKREMRILDIVERRGIRGVIFVLHKFCESNAFDYVRIKNKLKALGVETLLIETDNSISNEGQVKTRIQSFLEMIQ